MRTNYRRQRGRVLFGCLRSALVLWRLVCLKSSFYPRCVWKQSGGKERDVELNMNISSITMTDRLLLGGGIDRNANSRNHLRCICYTPSLWWNRLTSEDPRGKRRANESPTYVSCGRSQRVCILLLFLFRRFGGGMEFLGWRSRKALRK